MPKGQKIQQIYDESDYNALAPCGYYYQGRPSLIRTKARLHRKSCPLCRKLKRVINLTKEDYKAVAPPKRSDRILNNGLRSIDRGHKEKEINDFLRGY
jgi:hypothetical protein